MIPQTVNSNNKMNIISLQSIPHDLRYTVSWWIQYAYIYIQYAPHPLFSRKVNWKLYFGYIICSQKIAWTVLMILYRNMFTEVRTRIYKPETMLILTCILYSPEYGICMYLCFLGEQCSPLASCFYSISLIPTRTFGTGICTAISPHGKNMQQEP